MKMLATVCLSALALGATTMTAQAQAPAAPPPRPVGPPPPPARGPAIALALEAAQTAIATCAANGYKVGVVVVDSGGATRLVLLADDAPGRVADIGLRKAYTVITFKQPSGAVGDQAKTDKALADRIAADPKLITWAGGEPLKVGAEIIGAIGVSGAPGGDKDDACTAAGVAKIAGRLQ